MKFMFPHNLLSFIPYVLQLHNRINQLINYSSKQKREEALKKFRNGQFRVLISSGITARGIDVQQVSTVINFDIVKNVHTYLHAIGRSGRYGRKGLAINFVTKYDINIMKRIEKYYKINIKELPSNVKDLIQKLLAIRYIINYII